MRTKPAVALPQQGARGAEPYVPRAMLALLAEAPERRVHPVDGTCVLVDVSGFTSLSERLARRGGREGAEQLADAIGRCFERLLSVAYEKGGGLLKFGGDALLLLFDGDVHAERACAAAVAMSSELRAHGAIRTGTTTVQLRMSVGVHSDDYLLFSVGESHRELLIVGPGASEVVAMEKEAAAGQIVVSASTAARLPDRCLGTARGTGRLLRSAPPIIRAVPRNQPSGVNSQAAPLALSRALRAHVAAGPQPPEHRIVTVAFLRFEGTDALVAEQGPDGAATVLDQLVTLVQRAADAEQVCFLGSDIDADGGKLILTAGAPRALGDDDERMLLALRRVVEGAPPLPLRIGVAHGPCFAGDIGPPYRRTYTVMGDVVNLAARLMAKSPAGALYSGTAVLERSSTRFETTELEPFAVKGKALPVRALAVGRVRARDEFRDSVPVRFPLIGRDAELEQIARALDDARRGRGRLIELVSEPGMGRSRLMEEVRDRARNVPTLHATCEPYTTATPYRTWRELLRQVLGVAPDDPDALVHDRLRATLERDDPSLLEWLPLLAIALDIDVPRTRAVDQLAPDFRAERLHQVVLRFLRRQLPGWALIELAEVHLMDAASAALVHALARELPLLPWLVVVSRRDRETGFTAGRHRHVVHLELQPLAATDTLALAEAVTEDSPLPPHLVALAAERSGGSPQFLRDLLRAAASGSTELPDSIESAALARLDRLAPADRALIRRVSVLGLSFHPRQLDDLLGDDVTAPTPHTWSRLGLYFDEVEDGYLRFRRQVVRDVAYAGLPFRVRRELHAAAGSRLERDLGPEADDESVRLSVHFHHAGDHGKAWHYARVAADRASARFAHADAATLYGRALDAGRALDVSRTELATVWEALGAARARTGEPAAAAAAFTAARRLVRDQPVRTAELLHRHARVDVHAGRVLTAVRWIRRGLRTLEGVDGRPAAACRAHLTATLATVRQRQGRMDEAIRLCRDAIAEAEAAGADAALANACYILDWALVESGRGREAVYSGRALDLYAKLGQPGREAMVLNNMGGFAYRDGRWDEAVDLYRRGTELHLRAGDVGRSAYGDCNVAEVLSDQGRLEDAEVLLQRARRTWRSTGHEWGVASADALLGRVAARAGRYDDAVAQLRRARLAFGKLGAADDATWVDALVAEAHVLSCDAEQARDAADLLLAGLPSHARLAALLHRVRGCALAQLGDVGAATDALEASLAEARGQEEDYEIAVTLDALLRLAGRPEPAGRRAERDALLARLHVVALPAVPVAPI